jgi:superfamily II DNA or RNA helicase
MRDLSELTLQVAYHKGRDDIAGDFYLPCMDRAVRYDRAVGYFRSTAFLIAWPALKRFVERAGTMRILCSQVLANEDVDALEQGYAAQADERLGTRLREEVAALLRDPVLRAPAAVLAGLVAKGTLQLQIAILRESDMKRSKGRIFHDKLGLFHDTHGHSVMFKGSMNETWSGLSADGNLESIDVAASWLGGRDIERCEVERDYFDQLWTGEYPGLLVRPFPQVAREELTRAAPLNLEAAIDELDVEAGSLRDPRATYDVRGRVLKSHQALGLASWAANNRRGILAFATGAGKTFTAITAIREALSNLGETVIVIVPDRTLFAQWDAELRETLADLDPQVLRVGAGHGRWRASLRQWVAPSARRRLILATVQSASSPDFLNLIADARELMLVADEVHRLGSARHRGLLCGATFNARLGLSATPERYGDPEGTRALLHFFETILTPRYGLEDAIRDQVLTPYFYRPHAIRLDASEAEAWTKASAEIARLQARQLTGDPATGLSQRLQQALFARARIVKQARAKIDLAVKVIGRHYKPGERWLVYCDDSKQLAEVDAALAALGISTLSYHSTMAGDRAATLRWLDLKGGVVTAIKCLDEGVDIPSVTHALILASSKNPREFVQRRGRVLRRSPGKALAFIHDAIVLPPAKKEDDASEGRTDMMTAGELARAIEFASFSDNPAAGTDLNGIALEAGIDWEELVAKGDEDAED